MLLKRIKLQNFKCFENLEMELHPQCNILVGVNGAGKSTVLDAIAVSLGAYLSGYDDIPGKAFVPEDSHYRMYQVGTRVEAQEQYPVVIYTEAEIKQNEKKEFIKWQRELNGKGRRTTHVNARQIIDYSRQLQAEVRNGDNKAILPMIAYYGTGRLWLKKGNRRDVKKTDKLYRQRGYTDCLAAETNDKQMLQWFEEMTYIQLQDGKPIPELEAVKEAIRQCYLGMGDSVSEARFAYDVKNHELVVDLVRYGEKERIPVRMLSDGEKEMISLVADIAYRMAVLNPDLLDKILETPGIVLIDEVDLHLHPSWQRRIVSDLIRIFPNIQFVMTTHSPSILANAHKENVWILDQYKLIQPGLGTYGRELDEILNEIMHVTVLPTDVGKLQEEFDEAIDGKDCVSAENVLDKMRELIGENSERVIENRITLDVEKADI